MDLTFLEEIGFTKGEIKVYLALLECGTTTSGPIIIKSKVARSKVYEILEKLKEKGLVSDFIKNDTRYFQALSPFKILDYLKVKEQIVKDQQTTFKKLLPLLIEKQEVKQSEHQLRVYHDFEGIKTLYREMLLKLTPKDEYLGFSFSPEALMNKPVLRLLDNFHKIRSEKGAKAKILCTKDDKVNASKLKAPKNKFYEYRISRHPFPSSISIFQNTVATFIWGKIPKVFTITSKETAEHYRIFFNDLWKSAKVAY